MFIQTELTTNPATLKFLPGVEVLPKGKMEFAGPDAAVRSPLAQKLFAIEGIGHVEFGPDYILVSKNDGDWAELKPELLGALMDHFMSGDPVMYREGPPVGVADLSVLEGLAADVRDALKMVIDPELGYNIVDVGLIYDVAVEGEGDVHIRMTTTTRGCPATNYLQNGAQDAAWSVDGVETVQVEMTYDPEWSTDMMSDEAKMNFGIMR